MITSGMLLISGVLYIIFGDSNLKEWNDPPKKEKGLNSLTSKEKEIEANKLTNNLKQNSEEQNLLLKK